MRLHEAIEKVRHEGEIKRKCWHESICLVVKPDSVRIWYKEESDGLTTWIPNLDDITADDWEVVATEIREGDEVTINGSAGNIHYRVVALGDNNLNVALKAVDNDGHVAICSRAELIFISRPEKPVEYTFPVAGSYAQMDDDRSFNVAGEQLRISGFKFDSTKRYRMTLTEEK